ncbi:IclR family transcriptional regulator [Amycolatopsis pigmentata]|uniref:IclR family transcriptional regulator n=1 Tax=Amycolatopsis pigmentata TaxID=450801 RepID=A0ABW5FM83_9PSEU
MPDADRQGIQSVELAIRVLTALEQAGRPVPLSEVAKLANLYPSKVHRYLVSLIRGGLAEQEQSSGYYTLGLAARRLGVEAIRRGDEVTLATPYASRLRDTTEHTTNLATWGDTGPLIVRWDYGAYPLPITVRVGSTLPILDSSVGRVFLAHLPSALTAPALKAQQKRGETTRMDDDRVNDICQQVRDSGYSLTTGGVIPGLAAIAAPVFGPGLGLALVMSITLPTAALTRSVESQLVTALTNAAAELARDLGA